MNVNNAMYPLPASYSGIKQLQTQLDTLTAQLASGQKASTLADMGSTRYTDLTVRARLSRLTGYATNINTVNLRIDMMNQVLTSLSSVNSTVRSSAIAGAYGTNNINLATGPSTAQAQLDQVLSSLNADINGHYLFGGGVTDTAPVAGYDAAMNGAGGKDGFTTVAAQRLMADQGADGLGRLTVTTNADTVTLSEDGAHPFGFKVSSISAANPVLAVTQPAGTPAVPVSPDTMSVQFTAQPTAGDIVTIGLKLPDGTGDSIAMKAVTGTPANPGEYQIGATTADTAANFNTALTASLKSEGSTTLAAASNYAAATGFFNGQGQSVQRVAIDPVAGDYYHATGYETAAATANNTVSWYVGEDSNGNARTSVTSKVDDTTNVSYGIEADEGGITQLVRSLAVQSMQTYPATTDAETAASQAKFDAIADRQATSLSASRDGTPGSIASIGVDLGLAQTTLKNLSDRHTAYGAQLQTVLGDAETADPTEIASALLELQTRLSASYSATAMISQLQLANYLK